MVNMFNLLRGTCLFCHRFKLSRSVVRHYRQGTRGVVTKLFRRYASISPSFVYWNMVSWMLLKGLMIFGDKPRRGKMTATMRNLQMKHSKVLSSVSIYSSIFTSTAHRVANEIITRMASSSKSVKTLSRSSARLYK